MPSSLVLERPYILIGPTPTTYNLTRLELAIERSYQTHNMPANLEMSAVATGLEKVSFHSNPKERQCQRMLKLYSTIAFLSPSSKVMLKIVQTRLK